MVEPLEDGFYWIRVDGGRPEVAEWDGGAGCWFTTRGVHAEELAVRVFEGRLRLEEPARRAGVSARRRA